MLKSGHPNTLDLKIKDREGADLLLNLTESLGDGGRVWCVFMVWLLTQQTKELSCHWRPASLEGLWRSCFWQPDSTLLDALMTRLYFLRTFASIPDVSIVSKVSKTDGSSWE